MDSAVRLLSRVLLDKDVDTPLKAGITDDMFPAGEYRDAYHFTCGHMTKYGSVPSATAIKTEFQGLRLVKVDDGMDVVLDQFLAEWRKTVAKEMVTQMLEQMEHRKWSGEDVFDVVKTHLSKAELLTTGVGSIDLSVDALQELTEYDARKARAGSLLGISTGFPTIDEATLGLQPQQLVTIIAAPKTGKSQLAMRIAQTVYEQDLVPAFISFEMTNDEQKRRRSAMAYGLSHLRLMNSDLVSAEEKKYRAGIQAMLGKQSFHLLDSTNGMTVSAVLAQARVKKPNVLFIDGVYLMYDEITGDQGTPQAITNVTRNLKRGAQRLNIPVVITTQTLLSRMKKNRLDAGSIGYSSSFYQDSDVIFGLERGDEGTGDDYRLLKVVASRNTGPAEVELTWDWNSGVFEESTSSSTGFGIP